jgi:outer membrane protein assembly factor BamB
MIISFSSCYQHTEENANNQFSKTMVKQLEIWTLSTRQIPYKLESINQWNAEFLVYKGELIINWSIKNDSNTTTDNYRISKPYRSYPNYWGIYSKLILDGEMLDGLIDPTNGRFTSFYNNLGITDGEYIYTDDAVYPDSSNCIRISDMSVVWKGGTIGSVCSYFPTVFISNESLIYVDSCVGNPNQTIKRVNPKTGEQIWTLELEDSKQEEGKYGITLRESTSKFLIVRISEYLRVEGEKTKSILKGFYKINPSDGSVSKINIDPKYEINELLRCDDEILMCTNNLEMIEYNPDNDNVIIHDIAESLNLKPSSNIFFDASYIKDSKVLLTVNNFKNDTSHLQYFTYDFKSKKLSSISKEKANSIQVVNGSLIVEYGNKSECIDPETQETLWTIEYKKEGSVQWLDWRGVLTYQDNQLVCYAPKK